MSVLRGVYRFFHDFVIGDDWKIAVAALLSLAVGFALIGTNLFIGLTVPLTAAVVAVFFTLALAIDVRRQ
ncbi:hypothetical protein AB0J74_12285 [Asanoa sp. NPDC049573]|uniref:hypothetical protein n=1 Tax=Asanoa sp. NPDC049573 TaxID=3155396 RepID=UPI0034443B98